MADENKIQQNIETEHQISEPVSYHQIKMQELLLKTLIKTNEMEAKQDKQIKLLTDIKNCLIVLIVLVIIGAIIGISIASGSNGRIIDWLSKIYHNQF